MLRFSNSPNQQVNLARVLRKISRNLFADKCLQSIRNRKATVDGVMISDCDEVHAARAQLLIECNWLGTAVGKIKTSEEPFFRASAELGVNMKIAPAHGRFRVSRSSLIQSRYVFGLRVREKRRANRMICFHTSLNAISDG